MPSTVVKLGSTYASGGGISLASGSWTTPARPRTRTSHLDIWPRLVRVVPNATTPGRNGARPNRSGLASQSAQAQLAAIVRSSADAIFSMTEGGVITSWNPAAEAMFGYEPGDVIGHHLSQFFPDDPVLEELLDAARSGRTSPPRDTRWQTEDGSLVDVAVSVSHLDVGDDAGYSVPVRDVRVRKAAETQLRRQARWQTAAAEIRLSLLSEASLGTSLALVQMGSRPVRSQRRGADYTTKGSSPPDDDLVIQRLFGAGLRLQGGAELDRRPCRRDQGFLHYRRPRYDDQGNKGCDLCPRVSTRGRVTGQGGRRSGRRHRAARFPTYFEWSVPVAAPTNDLL
jgi:PAS domain S-box-containing protein